MNWGVNNTNVLLMGPLLRLCKGPIPSEFGRLSWLVRLEAYDNKLSGRRCVFCVNSFGVHRLRREFSMRIASGSIPSELGRLQSLTVFNFSDNRLTGLRGNPQFLSCMLMQF